MSKRGQFSISKLIAHFHSNTIFSNLLRAATAQNGRGRAQAALTEELERVNAENVEMEEQLKARRLLLEERRREREEHERQFLAERTKMAMQADRYDNMPMNPYSHSFLISTTMHEDNDCTARNTFRTQHLL